MAIHSTRATTRATASSSRTSTIDGPVRDCSPLAGLPRRPVPAFGVWSRGRRLTGLGGVASPGIGGAPGRVRGSWPVWRGVRTNGPTGPVVEAFGGGGRAEWGEVGWRLVGDAQQLGAQLGAGGRAVVGVARQQPVDQVDETPWDRRAQAAEVGRIALQAGEGGVGVGLAEERHPAGEALVQHEPQRVEVGPPVEAAAAHLLGRQVLGRPHHDVVAGQVVAGAVEALGDPEVGQQDPAVGGDEDVARLDVAVDEAGVVGGVERRRDARADVDRQLGAQPGLHVEQLAQALAVDELHDDGLAALVLEDVVDGDDVRVGQPGHGDGLTAETLGDDRVGGQARLEPLEGDLAIERDVGGEPHLGHPALRQSPLEPVAPGEHDGFGTAGRARARGRRGGRRRHSGPERYLRRPFVTGRVGTTLTVDMSLRSSRFGDGLGRRRGAGGRRCATVAVAS